MSDIIKAVILAAGEGSRMRPLTANRPKVMLPVAGKPIMEHLLISLISAGCSQFIFVVGYHSEKVKEHFADGTEWGVNIEYCHQPQVVGTADAVERLQDMVEDRFLVVNGDSIFLPADLAVFLNSSRAAMGLIEVDDATGLGVVETEGAAITRIHEKVSPPPTRIANAGIYLFTPEIFEAIDMLPPSTRGEYELPCAIQKMIDAGYEFGWIRISSWFTFSYPWDLLDPGDWLMQNLDFLNMATIEPGAVIQGEVSAGAGTVIRAGSYITGPAVIGNDCNIGPNCCIRPFSVIGDRCHVGAGVEIKNSIIMHNTRVPHLTYVGDSVIGENCNLGAGTQVANFRFDGCNIKIDGKDSRRRKLGVIMGDNVKTGINSNIDAGTVIAENSLLGPGALASGCYTAGSRIFG